MIIDSFDDKCQNLEREIYPPSVRHHGVGTALKYKVKEMTTDHDAPEVDLTIDEAVPRSNPGRECALYRVAYGLFQNVLKSAQATQVRVVMTFQEEAVTLTVKDNGKGFDVDSVVHQPWSPRSRFGIQWMLAHAEMYEGRMEFISPPGQGTTVQVTMPWPTESETNSRL